MIKLPEPWRKRIKDNMHLYNRELYVKMDHAYREYGNISYSISEFKHKNILYRYCRYLRFFFRRKQHDMNKKSP